MVSFDSLMQARRRKAIGDETPGYMADANDRFDRKHADALAAIKAREAASTQASARAA